MLIIVLINYKVQVPLLAENREASENLARARHCKRGANRIMPPRNNWEGAGSDDP